MMASGPKGVASLSKDHWIGLDHALSWVCFDEAFRILETLLRDVLAVVGMSEDQAKDEYQSAWRELANFASSNNWVVRGLPGGVSNRRARRRSSREIRSAQLRLCGLRSNASGANSPRLPNSTEISTG